MRWRLRLRPLNREDALARYASETAGCRLCALAHTRTQVVVGSGNPDADLMLVGEAPGFNEDRLGLVFAGRTGELVERLLATVGLTPDDVYLTTVVKCRPPPNRDPAEEEAAACEPHLFRQVGLIEPRVIATLGTFATRLLTARPHPIAELHGQPIATQIGGCAVTLLPLYHPAAALTSPVLFAELERDFATIPGLLGMAPPATRALADEPRDPPALPPPALGADAQLGLF